MKICVPTCESRLAADGYKVNEDVSGAVITKDTTFSTTNGKNFRSVEDFRTKYPLECSKSKRPKPTLTYQVVGSAGVNLANAKFDKINLNIQSGGKIDFSGTTITNGTLTTSSDIFVGQGHWTFTFKTTAAKPVSKPENTGRTWCRLQNYQCQHGHQRPVCLEYLNGYYSGYDF